MDQNVDEITQSFEVIEKEELDTDRETAVIDDESNNNSTPPAEVSTEISNDDYNNNGNKKYTRDELIKLKQTMENAAPDMEDHVKGFIFKKTTLDNTLDRSRPVQRSDAADKMMPAYAMPNNRNSYQKQRSGDYTTGRRSQQGNRSNSSSLIQVNLKPNEEIKLNEAKNAWKPTVLVGDVETPEDQKNSHETLKQFRSILNKITPENFPTLIEQLKTLNIDSVDILDSCISLVFEKAIMEPKFGASYAQLCKEVSDVFVVPMDESNKEQTAVFKKRLITQCQKEFEKHRDNELIKNNAERLKEIEDEEDAEKREEMKTNYELESFSLRRRAVGTVHFIGELYKIEMLTSRIMQSCITHLLDPAMCSEETLECLCKLLATIGKRLEKLDAKKIDLSDCFATLTRLADKKNPIGISSRIRFMIQDLIELRLNNWTPRKLQQQSGPSTMGEIKQQAAMEQYINKMENRERDGDRGNNRGGFQGGNNSGKRGNVVNEDGWSTQYSKSRPLKLDMNKLQILPQTDEIVLGGVPSFASFGNRFSGLEESVVVDQSMNRPYGGRHSGGGNGTGNNMNQNRNSGGNNFDRNNRGGNRSNNFGNNNNRSSGSRSLQPPMMGQMGGGQGSGQGGQKQFGPSRKTSYQPMQRPDLPMKASTLPRKISAPARPMHDRVIPERNLIANPDQVSDAIQKFVKAYGSEEMSLNDGVDKLRGFKITRQSLVLAYNWVFDQHDKERFHIAEIVCECVSHNLIDTCDLLEALQEIFELAQDLACDLPHVYMYMGQLMALPLLKRIIHFKEVLAMSIKEIDVKNGATVLKNILKVFEQKYDKQALTQVFNESGVDFQLFLDSETKLAEFLKENVSLN